MREYAGEIKADVKIRGGPICGNGMGFFFLLFDISSIKVTKVTPAGFCSRQRVCTGLRKSHEISLAAARAVLTTSPSPSQCLIQLLQEGFPLKQRQRDDSRLFFLPIMTFSCIICALLLWKGQKSDKNMNPLLKSSGLLGLACTALLLLNYRVITMSFLQRIQSAHVFATPSSSSLCGRRQIKP